MEDSSSAIGSEDDCAGTSSTISAMNDEPPPDCPEERDGSLFYGLSVVICVRTKVEISVERLSKLLKRGVRSFFCLWRTGVCLPHPAPASCWTAVVCSRGGYGYVDSGLLQGARGGDSRGVQLVCRLALTAIIYLSASYLLGGLMLLLRPSASALALRYQVLVLAVKVTVYGCCCLPLVVAFQVLSLPFILAYHCFRSARLCYMWAGRRVKSVMERRAEADARRLRTLRENELWRRRGWLVMMRARYQTSLARPVTHQANETMDTLDDMELQESGRHHYSDFARIAATVVEHEEEGVFRHVALYL